MEKYFYCSLTKLIFDDPVAAEDGYIYEYMAIDSWFKSSNVSPSTGKKVGKTLIKLVDFKNLVHDYMNEHSELHHMWFKKRKPYNLFRDQFRKQLIAKDWKELYNYTSIILNDYFELSRNDYTTNFGYLSKFCQDNSLIIYLIDNSIDYDTEDVFSFRPIHYACQNADLEVIQYLVEKNVDIECLDLFDKKPSHYICQYRNDNPDLVKYFLNLDIDLKSYDTNGNMPIHLLILNLEKLDSLKIFVEKDFDMNLETLHGSRPVHLISLWSKNPNHIKYVFDLKINLESPDKNNKTCDELIFENQYLNKKQKQEMLYYYLNKIINRPNIIEDYYDKLNKLNKLDE